MKSLLSFICFLMVSGFLMAQPGNKIRMTTQVDGKNREYYLHIPSSYDGQTAVPMVFMLHGTSGDGEKMYETSGWAELAEKENLIAVFPSSLRYKIVDGGEEKTTTKWNTLLDASWYLQPGETGADDIKFLRKVVSEVSANYNINENKIYLNGFSNGGQMAAKCAIELSDLLAAVCMNAGSFFLDTVYVPNRKIPLLYQVGNMDYGPGNVGPEIPLAYFDSLISTPDLPFFNGKLYRTARNITRNFSLKTEHSIVGDTNTVVIATYLPIDPQDSHELKYTYVKGLAHSYPNWAPSEHWNWMKKYTRDSGTPTGNLLTTQQGYGGGIYEPGKEIHIWSRQIDGKVFTHWSGDSSFLETPNEYHSRLIMPDRDITVAANYADLQPDMVMKVYNTMGKERMKRFYAYAPADKSSIRGVVWFFHGTNGNALSLISDPDTRQMIQLLMVHNYAVVALTSEESEFNIDFDNDGNLRWSYGIDSSLVDIANVRAIRDTLINRNFFDHITPHAAIGWSAGGAFTEFIANTLGWKAAINHTSSGNEILSKNPLVVVPYLVSINENDNNPGVGPQGNANARIYVQNYLDRGACARLHEQLEAPLYAQRFDRSPLIDESLSVQIFNEIKNNNALDSNHFLKIRPGQLAVFVAANPSGFPVILSLSPEQRNAVLKQLEVTYADHSFKADINGMSLKFIENGCGPVSSTSDPKSISEISLWPNPASQFIHLDGYAGPWELTGLFGQSIKRGKTTDIDISSLEPGIYFLRTQQATLKVLKASN